MELFYLGLLHIIYKRVCKSYLQSGDVFPASPVYLVLLGRPILATDFAPVYRVYLSTVSTMSTVYSVYHVYLSTVSTMSTLSTVSTSPHQEGNYDGYITHRSFDFFVCVHWNHRRRVDVIMRIGMRECEDAKRSTIRKRDAAYQL